MMLKKIKLTKKVYSAFGYVLFVMAFSTVTTGVLANNNGDVIVGSLLIIVDMVLLALRSTLFKTELSKPKDI